MISPKGPPEGRNAPFGKTGFLRASERYDTSVNPVLQKVGVETFDAFIDHLEAYLVKIPELALVQQAAAKHGLSAALSGGSARAIVAAYLKDVQRSGRAEVTPERSLFQMLEGSDVDVLVIKPAVRGKPAPVSDAQLQQLADDLNLVSGAQLVSQLPPLERRLVAAEWDVADAHRFAGLNEAFGGDSSSLFGLGLAGDGELLVYDPYDALHDIFRGQMRYIHGEDPYGHDMVVSGKFDPALDGLRLIRMAGQMKQVGVELSPDAHHSLAELGQEANRRLWEIEARIDYSPDGKLGRRWAKYVKKLWPDHADPNHARALLESSGYDRVLSKLGLKRYSIHPLNKKRAPKTQAHPAMQGAVRNAATSLKSVLTKVSSGEYYVWMSRTLSQLAQATPRKLFGADAGEWGAGVYLGAERVYDGGVGSVLVRAVVEDATLIDVTTTAGKEAVHAVLEETRPSYTAANDQGATAEEVRAAQLHDLCVAVGADGFRSAEGIVLQHQAPIAELQAEPSLSATLAAQLNSSMNRANTENLVRSWLALTSSTGFAPLREWLTKGTVTLEQLFTEGATPGGLFIDVPTLEPEFAAFLGGLRAKATDDQRQHLDAAIAHLRGELPKSSATRAPD